MSSGCFLHFPWSWCAYIWSWYAQGRKISDILWRSKRFPGSFNTSNITLLWIRKSTSNFSRITSISQKFIYQPFPEYNLGLWLKLLGKTVVSCKNQWVSCKYLPFLCFCICFCFYLFWYSNKGVARPIPSFSLDP